MLIFRTTGDDIAAGCESARSDQYYTFFPPRQTSSTFSFSSLLKSENVPLLSLHQQLEDECAAHIVPVIKHAVEDRSWRVRCAMARGFAEAARAVGPKLTTVELLPCLTRYVFIFKSVVGIDGSCGITFQYGCSRRTRHRLVGVFSRRYGHRCWRGRHQHHRVMEGVSHLFVVVLLGIPHSLLSCLAPRWRLFFFFGGCLSPMPASNVDVDEGAPFEYRVFQKPPSWSNYDCSLLELTANADEGT